MVEMYDNTNEIYHRRRKGNNNGKKAKEEEEEEESSEKYIQFHWISPILPSNGG